MKLNGQEVCAITDKLVDVTPPRKKVKEEVEKIQNSIRKAPPMPKHKDRQGNWRQTWPLNVKGNGQQVCAITDKPCDEASEERRDVRVAKEREVLTPPGKKVEEEVEEMSRVIRTSAAHEVPADDEGGRSAMSREGTAAKKTAGAGRACCRTVGGGTWLRRVKGNSAVSDVDQKRRRGKHDKFKNSGPFGKRESCDVGQNDVQCASSTARLYGLDQEGAGGRVRDPIHELEGHGNGQNGSSTAEQHFPSGPSASLQEDARYPQYAFLPAGTNDDMEITMKLSGL